MRADHLVVVLVRPEHAGNIGAAARALGNLGLGDLRLVGGVAIDRDARAMACAFQDLLAGATRHDDLPSALSDCVYAVALVSPMRAREQAPAPLRSLTSLIAAQTAHGKVALVFGSEQSGLVHDDVARCSVAATLPLPSPWPTLNLAQAVLLACYELTCVPGSAVAPVIAHAAPPAEAPAPQAEVDAALHALSHALAELGYGADLDGSLHHKILARCRAIVLRAGLSRADVQMLHGLLARLDRRRC